MNPAKEVHAINRDALVESPLNTSSYVHSVIGNKISSRILNQAKQNFELLFSEPLLRQDPSLLELERWTTGYFEEHQPHFTNRSILGFIRECHGDLHCGNIVFWNGKWVPFDGVEFNPEYFWIDVVSDIAFLAMDMNALGHPELSAALLNAYMEETGDYHSIKILRWYLVYRALVRAKVAVMRARQANQVQRRNIRTFVHLLASPHYP